MGHLRADEIEGEADNKRCCGKLRFYHLFLFHYGRWFYQYGFQLYYRFSEQQRNDYIYRYGDGFQRQGFCGGNREHYCGSVFPAFVQQLPFTAMLKQWNGK